MEGFLRPGLPMRQFAGFGTLTEPVLASDPLIASIAAFDQEGQRVFAGGDASIGLLPATGRAAGAPAIAGDLRESEAHPQVVLPLRSRFEAVGSLAVTVRRDVIRARVEDAFASLLGIAGVASLAFTLFVVLGGPRLDQGRVPWVGAAFAATFLGIAALVATTLVGPTPTGRRRRAARWRNRSGRGWATSPPSTSTSTRSTAWTGSSASTGA